MDEEILQRALLEKADMVITHHPFFFKSLRNINFDSPAGKIIKRLIKADINVYSAHTNLDAGEQGLNQILAEKLDLQEIEPLDRYRGEELYKIVVFVPVSHLEVVRTALNNAGAGSLGSYCDWSFRTAGKAVFRPDETASPFIGSKGILEEVDEYRLETVCQKRDLKKLTQLINKVHPYEEGAYDIYKLENEYKVFSMGRKGVLKSPMSLEQYALLVKEFLQLENVRVAGNLDKEIHSIAVVGGAGAGFIDTAAAQGIDVLITGDVKYHEVKDAVSMGLAVIDAGHQGTERIVGSYLCDLLAEESRKRGYYISFIPADGEFLFKFV